MQAASLQGSRLMYAAASRGEVQVDHYEQLRDPTQQLWVWADADDNCTASVVAQSTPEGVGTVLAYTSRPASTESIITTQQMLGVSGSNNLLTAR